MLINNQGTFAALVDDLAQRVTGTRLQLTARALLVRRHSLSLIAHRLAIAQGLQQAFEDALCKLVADAVLASASRANLELIPNGTGSGGVVLPADIDCVLRVCFGGQGREGEQAEPTVTPMRAARGTLARTRPAVGLPDAILFPAPPADSTNAPAAMSSA